MEQLASELQRSLDFYLTTSGERQVSRVYCSGGTANIRSLLDSIQRRAGVPVLRLDPFNGFLLPGKNVDPIEIDERSAQAVVAVGLALRKERERRS